MNGYPFPQTFAAWIARDAQCIGCHAPALDAWFGEDKQRFTGADAERDARQWIVDHLGEHPDAEDYGIRLAGEAGFSIVEPIFESPESRLGLGAGLDDDPLPEEFEPVFIGGLDGSPFPNDASY